MKSERKTCEIKHPTVNLHAGMNEISLKSAVDKFDDSFSYKCRVLEMNKYRPTLFSSFLTVFVICLIILCNLSSFFIPCRNRLEI